MEILDYLILAFVATGIVYAFIASRRAKKKGRGCCTGCSGCSMSSSCSQNCNNTIKQDKK